MFYKWKYCRTSHTMCRKKQILLHAVFHLFQKVNFYKRWKKRVICFIPMSVWSCLTLCDSMTITHQAPLTWNFPDKNTGVGCHFLLQGIFPTRYQTWVSYISCIGRRIIYHYTTWEVPLYTQYNYVIIYINHLYIYMVLIDGTVRDVACYNNYNNYPSYNKS